MSLRDSSNVPLAPKNQMGKPGHLITDKYEKLQKIGEGTYGDVFRGRDRETNQIVAMKKIKLEHTEEGVPSTAVREISLLKELNHETVIRLLNVVNYRRKLWLIFEFLDQDLKKYMDSVTSLSPNLIKKYVEQILTGLQYCHSRRIMHRDLKPQNLLIDSNGHLKLADFGLARAFCVPVRPYTHEVITLWYRAPEILLGSLSYSLPVDIWSTGCILIEMVNKKPFFVGDSEIDQLHKIFQVMGTPNETVWPGVTVFPDYNIQFPNWKPQNLQNFLSRSDPYLCDLLAKMLVYEPSKRISARKALEHPYFTSVRNTNKITF